MLHTIVSELDVFAAQNVTEPPLFARIDGGMIEYRRNGKTGTVVRLHTTDPFLYLDKRYAPCARFSPDKPALS
ncbi:MAG: YlzJ-like family protein [Oscillospiraceae bacterium]